MLSCFLFGQIFYIRNFQISIVSCDFKKRKNNTVIFYGRLRDVIRKYGADFLLARADFLPSPIITQGRDGGAAPPAIAKGARGGGVRNDIADYKGKWQIAELVGAQVDSSIGTQAAKLIGAQVINFGRSAN